MQIVISTDSSNAIFTAPIERVLDSVAYTVFDLAKYKWLYMTKGKLAENFRGCCIDDFKVLIECITLNQSGVVHTIEFDDCDEREEYNVSDAFNCTYDELFNSLCDILSSYTLHGFYRDEENFKAIMDYFIMQLTFDIQGYQYMDVYYYFKSLYCTEDEFLAMLSDDLKVIAKDSLVFVKDHYDDFDIQKSSDMEELLDNMSTSSDDVINILRECVK